MIGMYPNHGRMQCFLEMFWKVPSTTGERFWTMVEYADLKGHVASLGQKRPSVSVSDGSLRWRGRGG